jgi:hypothetical protein
VFRSDAFVAQLAVAHHLRRSGRLERLAALRGLTLATIRSLAIRPAYSTTGRRLPAEVFALVDMVARAAVLLRAPLGTTKTTRAA